MCEDSQQQVARGQGWTKRARTCKSDRHRPGEPAAEVGAAALAGGLLLVVIGEGHRAGEGGVGEGRVMGWRGITGASCSLNVADAARFWMGVVSANDADGGHWEENDGACAGE